LINGSVRSRESECDGSGVSTPVSRQGQKVGMFGENMETILSTHERTGES